MIEKKRDAGKIVDSQTEVQLPVKNVRNMVAEELGTNFLKVNKRQEHSGSPPACELSQSRSLPKRASLYNHKYIRTPNCYHLAVFRKTNQICIIPSGINALEN